MSIQGPIDLMAMAPVNPPQRFYLIKNGVLDPAASYMRGGSIVIDGENVPLNTPPRYQNEYIHNGQVTHDSPSYNIAPITRPPQGQSYGTAAAASGSLNGLTVPIKETKTGWLWDLLDGVADGPELLSNTEFNGLDGWTKYSSPDLLESVNYLGRPSVHWVTSNNHEGGVSQPITNIKGRAEWSIYSTGDLGLRASVTCDNLSGLLPSHTSTWRRNVKRGDLDTSQFYIWSLSNMVGSHYASSPSLKAVSPSIGSFLYKSHIIYPSLSEWSTPGDKIILIGRQVGASTIEPVFYIDKTTGKYMLTDGTNTAVSPTPYTPGFPCNVKIVPLVDKMRIDKDGASGEEVPFVGTLLHGTNTIKFNVGVEDITTVTDIYGELP